MELGGESLAGLPVRVLLTNCVRSDGAMGLAYALGRAGAESLGRTSAIVVVDDAVPFDCYSDCRSAFNVSSSL